MSLRIPYKTGNFMTSSATISFSRRTLLHVFSGTCHYSSCITTCNTIIKAIYNLKAEFKHFDNLIGPKSINLFSIDIKVSDMKTKLHTY